MITSVLEKQTSAILEFYFRFRSWPFRHNLHVILLEPAEFCPKSEHLLRTYDVICIFQDGGRDHSILLPVSHLLMPLPLESQNLSVHQISLTHLNSWLRYFRFRKTNVHHIGILLPVLYLLMSLPSEGQSLSANQILSTYLNSQLRCNYFRFWKTNVRHIGILLPVSISTTLL